MGTRSSVSDDGDFLRLYKEHHQLWRFNHEAKKRRITRNTNQKKVVKWIKKKLRIDKHPSFPLYLNPPTTYVFLTSIIFHFVSIPFDDPLSASITFEELAWVLHDPEMHTNIILRWFLTSIENNTDLNFKDYVQKEQRYTFHMIWLISLV